MKVTYKHISRYIIIFLLFPLDGYAQYNIKYYDAKTAVTNYNGLKHFQNELANITDYIYTQKDYYIAYYDAEKRLVKYKYIDNGNVVHEEVLIYQGTQIKGLKTYIQKQLKRITIFYKNKLVVKRYNPITKTYIKIFYRAKDKQIRRVENYYKDKKLKNYTLFSYSKQNKKIKVSYYTPSNILLQYIKYQYNKKGLQAKKTRYNNKNHIIGYSIYKYNDKDNLQEARRFDYNNNLLGYITYEYFDSGKLRYKLYYDGQGKLIPR